MNVETKYNIHDSVLFLKDNGNSTGDVAVKGGIVRSFTINCEDTSIIKIVYGVIMDPDRMDGDGEWVEIYEHHLFKDEKDVMKFFRKNMKIQLEDVETKRKRLEEAGKPCGDFDDDLPF